LLEPGPEWRSAHGEGPERADVTSGLDITRHDLGLGSKFEISREYSPAQRARLRRLRVLQERSRASSWEDKSLRDALIELGKICGDLSLPKGVRAEASVNYRRAKAGGMTVGRDMRQVMRVVVFFTCRLRGLPRTEDEVVRALSSRYGMSSSVARRSIHRLVRLLREALEVEERRITAEDYFGRFAPQLHLSGAAVEQTRKIFRRLPRSFRTKPQLFLAAVLIYVGAKRAGDDVTLQDVAKEMNVGISSLSQNAARLSALLEEEQQ
jgi:transcription initiation factor TFIIB